ncbi:MAG: lipid-A-disaccharide synthase [Alphaproteobacteria bacterium]
MTAPVIFLIAGEPSGDLLGAHLMKALRRLGPPDLRFAGIGGPRMVEAGIELFFSQKELAHFGLAELLVHIPHLLRRIDQTAAEVERMKPAALVTIDAPDFCFRVAKRLKGKGIPLIHYVAPTVWAWRAGRAKKIARFLDHLLALLPFEPPYFTEAGLPCSFVGHPIIESGAANGDAARFRAAHGLSETTPVLSVLLGSRTSEVTRLARIFAETLALLKSRNPDLADLVCAVPTVPQVEMQVRALTKDWAVPVIVTTGDAAKYDGFKASTAALACSGTVALELALARLPAVIAYRISPVTAFLYRRLIKVRYANLVNIMHDRPVVPEFLQELCTPDRLAAACEILLADPAARAAQAAQLAQTAVWLGAEDEAPSARAARVVLNVSGLEKRP